MEREMKLYGDRVYGVKVSEYGLKNGYLDYYTLADIVGDMVLNNDIYELDGWELESGQDCYGVNAEYEHCDPDDDECCDVIYHDVYQYYIITASGAEFLANNTDEIVYYNYRFDMYLWGITHFGTSWDYVLTDIRLKEGN